MLSEFSLTAPTPLPVQVNIFFIVLAIATSIIGGYSALQFTESLILSTLKKNVHKKTRTVLILIAASFSIGINAVFVMHILSMSSVTPKYIPIRYALAETIGSIFCIFVGALLAYVIWTGGHKDGILASRGDSSPLIQIYYSLPDESAPWRDHLGFMVKANLLFIKKPAFWISGTFLGVGVLSMHYVGMNAMRGPLKAVYNPIMVGFEVLIGPVAGSVLMGVLFSALGLKKRLLGAVVLGIGATVAHWYGWFSGVYTSLSPGEHMHSMAGEILVDGEVMCVVLILISSVVRFGFMGLITK